MATSLIRNLALISESTRVNLSELAVVSAALQKQAIRDVGPIWNVQATVDVFANLEDVPVGYWSMIVMDNIGANAAGIHSDKDGQPFALITASDDNDVWSLTASHECVEMLIDPFGDRLIAGDSPKPDQGRVLFLVEVCDPSESADFGYSSNGILVSDFYTPHFFDPVVSAGVRYSYTDAVTEPRQVLSGGYLSWLDPVSDHWWQETFFDGTQSNFRDLGPLNAANGSFRAQIDRITGEETSKAVESGRANALSAGLTAAVLKDSTNARAASLRAQISEIVGSSSGPAKTTGAPKRRSPRRRS